MSGDATWLETMPQVYHRCLVPALFAPYARFVAELAARRAPRTVLELAAGSGVLTRELAAVLPQAEITATDLNPAMVSRGGPSRCPGRSGQRRTRSGFPSPRRPSTWSCANSE